jgi:Mg2+ and Co2+ transporter CorA
MAKLTKDIGMIAALLMGFESHVLPRLLALKQKVGGAALDAADISFLEEFQHTASSIQRLIEQHPEYEDLFSRAVDLYSEIVAAAYNNEQGA